VAEDTHRAILDARVQFPINGVLHCENPAGRDFYIVGPAGLLGAGQRGVFGEFSLNRCYAGLSLQNVAGVMFLVDALSDPM